MSDVSPNVDGNPSFATEINNLKAEVQRLEGDSAEIGQLNSIIAAMEAKEADRGIATTPGAPGPLTQSATPTSPAPVGTGGATDPVAPSQPSVPGDQFTTTESLGGGVASTGAETAAP